MYRKLLPLMKRFVFIRQGAFNRYYEGKLIAIDPETLQVQSYKKDGTEEEVWTISLDSISEFSTGGRHLAEMELKVSFAASSHGEAEEEEVHDAELATANSSDTLDS
jgi:hypothetical protein